MILPCQKKCQIDIEQHKLLHDMTCCWIYVRTYMLRTFPGDVVSKHEEMWRTGCLDRMWSAKIRSRMVLAGQIVIDPEKFWLGCD